MRKDFAAILTAAAVSLAGCSAMNAQNPGAGYTPVNAVADDSGARLMLKGHDVVAYFTRGSHAPGAAAHSVVYRDVTFRFASAEHKALFEQAPEKYLPQYGGYCANGIAYGIPWGGDADTWKIIDGKLYIFGGQASKDAFLLDQPTNLQRADHYWRSEIAGANSFLQRGKRLVLRVPHYKSGEELAREVAQAQAAGKR